MAAPVTNLAAGHVGEHIAVEMDRAPLPVGIGKDFRHRFGQSQAGVGDHQTNAFEAALLQVLEKTQPTGLVLLVAFSHTEHPPKPVLVDADGRQNGNIYHCQALNRLLQCVYCPYGMSRSSV